jgi:hypothetical protein
MNRSVAKSDQYNNFVMAPIISLNKQNLDHNTGIYSVAECRVTDKIVYKNMQWIHWLTLGY